MLHMNPTLASSITARAEYKKQFAHALMNAAIEEVKVYLDHIKECKGPACNEWISAAYRAG